jgi:hypothetical protein
MLETNLPTPLSEAEFMAIELSGEMIRVPPKVSVAVHLLYSIYAAAKEASEPCDPDDQSRNLHAFMR